MKSYLRLLWVTMGDKLINQVNFNLDMVKKYDKILKNRLFQPQHVYHQFDFVKQPCNSCMLQSLNSESKTQFIRVLTIESLQDQSLKDGWQESIGHEKTNNYV